MKIINGLEIEGVIPRGMGDITFKKQGKRIIEGRYWNTNGTAIAIVASVTLAHDRGLNCTRPFDWSAYIGGTPSKFLEEETMEFAWRYGAKLSEKDARHYFPNLKDITYRL